MGHEYEPCDCGANCDLYESQERYGECWGSVEQIDEAYNEETGDCQRIHGCEGHCEHYYGGKYQPKPKNKD